MRQLSENQKKNYRNWTIIAIIILLILGFGAIFQGITGLAIAALIIIFAIVFIINWMYRDIVKRK
jgi:uncharacterized membrane protein HdeD (DUF308 family)